jgi:S-adenosylmethionine:tRNA ribosyltransferase-isomerase
MTKDLYSLSSYQFNLPEELVAQQPCTPRDSSRLMVVDRASGNISEMVFRELKDFLQAGDQLIFNNTKVIPARLFGVRSSGGSAEILLIRQHADHSWDVLARPGRKMRVGDRVTFNDTFSCEILETLPDGGKRVVFQYPGSDFYAVLEQYGQMPLPHYIRREAPTNEDKERYQTVYALQPGAAAAPTAGLHFTQDMLDHFSHTHVKQTHVTLHTGLGTFKPVQVEDIRQHQMHYERCVISETAANQINTQDRAFRQICVGTTCCRCLESSSNTQGIVVPGDYETNAFIYPGYSFKVVRSLLTNFHFPGSSLLMLVSAFAGHELIMEAYEKAVKERYRFFSYGDAMLIL